jgi:hypothetical protein
VLCHSDRDSAGKTEREINPPGEVTRLPLTRKCTSFMARQHEVKDFFDLISRNVMNSFEFSLRH